MQVEKPNVIIADSIICAENLRQEILRSCPLNKFKCIQTKLFEVSNWQSSLMTYLPVNFGGTHSGQASLTIFGQLLNLEFWPLLKPPPKKPSRAPGGGKRIVLHTGSDDSSEEEA